MQHKKYTEGEELTNDELESISEQLIQAKFDREKRTAWTQRLKDDFGVEKTESKPPFSFRKIAIAAAIISILGIVTYTIFTSTTSTYETMVDTSIENLVVIDNFAVVTRGDISIDEQVLQAIIAYKEGDYNKSITHWETIIATEKVKGFASYNIALCYLQKTPTQTEKAISYLLEAIHIKTVQQEANWALALAYLDANQKKKAIEILQQIVAVKAYKHEKAQQLLDML